MTEEQFSTTPGLNSRFEDIISLTLYNSAGLDIIGSSRDNRPIYAGKFGSGNFHISLLAGCHADEPVGPRLLRFLCNYLYTLKPGDPLLTDYTWWLIPHINPDGEKKNSNWQEGSSGKYDIYKYLKYAKRELPGDDIEFGFPANQDDEGARPENRAAFHWWKTNNRGFNLHVSLHGMSFAGGPWYLISQDWIERSIKIQNICAHMVNKLGYSLHDVQRNGEKGFYRIKRGFCTHPLYSAMKKFFLDKGDEKTASLFRPSSMEAIQGFGKDPLTLVSETPLFITPGVGETIGPPDPKADEWKIRIEKWQQRILQGENQLTIKKEIGSSSLKPMPVQDQMRLQWNFIIAGIEREN